MLVNDIMKVITELLFLTSEIFDFEILRTGFLSQERIVEHDFSLSFNSLVELTHGHMTETLHVLTHLIIRLQLQTSLKDNMIKTPLKLTNNHKTRDDTL